MDASVSFYVLSCDRSCQFPSSKPYSHLKISSLRGSFRWCHNLPFSVKKIKSLLVLCSSMEGELKPRPVRKPSLATETRAIAPNPLESINAQRAAQPDPLTLCNQIEKLVCFKKYKEAIELFKIMQLYAGSSGSHQALDASAYDSLIAACISLQSARAARSVYNHMKNCKFEFDQYMNNRVLLMHLRCGMIQPANYLFDEMSERNLVSWNTIVSGLVNAGYYSGALKTFLQMWKEISDVSSRTLATIVRAAAGLASVDIGMQFHSIAIKFGLYDNLFVSCALIDMYGKCGCIEEALWVFDEMPEKNVTGWNSLIAGFTLNGYSEEALDLYYEMQNSYVKMDHFTYSTIIRICAQSGSLEQGQQAHARLVRNGFGRDIIACTSLVDLYGKWGRMDDAKKAFDKMPCKNLISWNALIGGYGNHGMAAEAIATFERMEKEGVIPNHVTFLAVLGACSYSGMLKKGREIFERMTRDPRMKPRAMHYACMIELLGREGLFNEALGLINIAPFDPTANMWAALLTACRMHKNLELGKLTAEKLFAMEPEKVGNYIVLLNIYNRGRRVDDAARVLDVLKKKGLGLHPACSWIEIKKKPHGFLFGDKSHPHSDEIYERLNALMLEITREGFVPQKSCFLSDVVDQEQRIQRYHGELLAIAFGLISTPNSTPLQVIQGHRLCNDCHTAIKLVTMIMRREIVVRDGSRFHHFRDGVCSCGNYW
ncbi:Pentatricopeptide repeat-containing protein [Apostasia shenzhenica]|uniref:Pentatricopeptide repeat-containing protein n=1 Tax=Apostasia shenzhenica TaxID=1088818 RepID=A0A2I0ADA8_9ASPA|nr:Pentatricopeptide repeat-containing protein [Apostasia shenzhenica]